MYGLGFWFWPVPACVQAEGAADEAWDGDGQDCGGTHHWYVWFVECWLGVSGGVVVNVPNGLCGKCQSGCQVRNATAISRVDAKASRISGRVHKRPRGRGLRCCPAVIGHAWLSSSKIAMSHVLSGYALHARYSDPKTGTSG